MPVAMAVAAEAAAAVVEKEVRVGWLMAVMKVAEGLRWRWWWQ